MTNSSENTFVEGIKCRLVEISLTDGTVTTTVITQFSCHFDHQGSLSDFAVAYCLFCFLNIACTTSVDIESSNFPTFSMNVGFFLRLKY